MSGLAGALGAHGIPGTPGIGHEREGRESVEGRGTEERERERE